MVGHGGQRSSPRKPRQKGYVPGKMRRSARNTVVHPLIPGLGDAGRPEASATRSLTAPDDVLRLVVALDHGGVVGRRERIELGEFGGFRPVPTQRSSGDRSELASRIANNA